MTRLDKAKKAAEKNLPENKQMLYKYYACVIKLML